MTALVGGDYYRHHPPQNTRRPSFLHALVLGGFVGCCGLNDLPCDGSDAERQCLDVVAQAGLGALGTTRELVLTCGDENPPLQLLRMMPDAFLRSWDSSKVEQATSKFPVDESQLAWTEAAVETIRSHALKVFSLTLSFAYTCVAGSACLSRALIISELKHSQASFMKSVSSLVATTDVNTQQWIPRLGHPPQMLIRSAFSERLLDFTEAILSAAASADVSETALVQFMQDLSMRLAMAGCEVQAKLLAHLKLYPQRSAQGLSLLSTPSKTTFEFRHGVCCRRYHILSQLLTELQADMDRPLRMLEVGVNNGLTSEYVVSRFPDLSFDGVDPWINAEALEAEARNRLSRFGPRSRLWRKTSLEAAGTAADRSLLGLATTLPLENPASVASTQDGLLDLVFIDGDHSEQGVLEDIRLWRPLLRPGGILAGHDLFNPAFDGVLSALLVDLNHRSTESIVHFGPDFVWWLYV
mmetsp:Transcript_24236/g.51663  ORF Transcript_24236/g.51663 Transcript_24236/m.51663 type:complete len:469 (-) Transcript_24236:310-1716(-)